MQPDFNPQVHKRAGHEGHRPGKLISKTVMIRSLHGVISAWLSNIVTLLSLQVTSAVVMGITSDKLSLELAGKRYCYYGRTQSNPYGSAAACDLAIASGAVTLSLCVIFSAIALINALRGADHKLFHMAEYILMIIVELLWIVFLIYQMAAKTALHAAVYGALGDDMVSGIVVIVFCALSIGFTVSVLFAFDSLVSANFSVI